MEPVEEADMGVEVRCAEALQQLCQTQAKITTLPIVCMQAGILFDTHPKSVDVMN